MLVSGPQFTGGEERGRELRAVRKNPHWSVAGQFPRKLTLRFAWSKFIGKCSLSDSYGEVKEAESGRGERRGVTQLQQSLRHPLGSSEVGINLQSWLPWGNWVGPFKGHFNPQTAFLGCEPPWWGIWPWSRLLSLVKNSYPRFSCELSVITTPRWWFWGDLGGNPQHA